MVLTVDAFPFRTHNRLPVLQEQVGQKDGHMHEAAAISPQVDDHPLGPGFGVLTQCVEEFLGRVLCKTAELDIDDAGFWRIGRLDALDGNLVAPDHIVPRLTVPQGRHRHMAAFGSTQTRLHRLGGEPDSGNRLAVNRHDLVASPQAHRFRRAAHDHRLDGQGVVEHHIFDAHAFERAFQLFIGRRHLRCRDIGGMRVELIHQPHHHGVDSLVEIHGIDITCLDVEKGAGNLFGVAAHG